MFPTKEDSRGLRVPLVSFTGRDPSLSAEYPVFSAMRSCLSFGINPPLHPQCVSRGFFVPAVTLARGEKFYPSRLGGRKTRKMPLGLFRVFGQEEKLLPPRTGREENFLPRVVLT